MLRLQVESSGSRISSFLLSNSYRGAPDEVGEREETQKENLILRSFCFAGGFSRLISSLSVLMSWHAI